VHKPHGPDAIAASHRWSRINGTPMAAACGRIIEHKQSLHNGKFACDTLACYKKTCHPDAPCKGATPHRHWLPESE
jgi:hypothetical protein